uniref:TIR domain-containing protein n=2 Tax=Chrysotila carterae TaxID=13221 RepID=A0A7S4F2G1_CHRCT
MSLPLSIRGTYFMANQSNACIGSLSIFHHHVAAEYTSRPGSVCQSVYTAWRAVKLTAYSASEATLVAAGVMYTAPKSRYPGCYGCGYFSWLNLNMLTFTFAFARPCSSSPPECGTQVPADYTSDNYQLICAGGCDSPSYRASASHRLMSVVENSQSPPNAPSGLAQAAPPPPAKTEANPFPPPRSPSPMLAISSNPPPKGPPPASTLAALVRIEWVRVDLLVLSTVDAFNSSEFQTAFAEHCAVSTSRVRIDSVRGGSLLVTSFIDAPAVLNTTSAVPPTPASWAPAVFVHLAKPPTVLSAALRVLVDATPGVAVRAVCMAAERCVTDSLIVTVNATEIAQAQAENSDALLALLVDVMIAPPPSAIPCSPPSSTSRSDGVSAWVIAVAASATACVAAAVALLFCLRRRSVSAQQVAKRRQCVLTPQRHFIAFLSHYKAEAGCEARYIKTMMEQVSGGRFFLDSSDLVDLRMLIEDGLQQSDCLVLLLTKGVLTRPWCLLEIWEAVKRDIPIVPIVVSGRGYSVESARKTLCEMQEDPTAVEALAPLLGEHFNLRLLRETVAAAIGVELLNPQRADAAEQVNWNASLLDAMRSKVSGVSLRGDDDQGSVHGGSVHGAESQRRLSHCLALPSHRLQDLPERAAQLSAAGRQGRVLTFDACGTDNQVSAEIEDLMERIAAATNRKLEWYEVTVDQANRLQRSTAKLPRHSENSEEKRISFGSSTDTSARPGAPKMLRRRDQKKYAFFISYYRSEAGPQARLLHAKLRDSLLEPCYLDASDATDVRKIIDEGVARSSVVLLLQTAKVLERPWVLLELHEAVERGIPIVPINIQGGGYDFDAARNFLSDMENELKKVDVGALKVLKKELNARGFDVQHLQESLLETVLTAISIKFDPAGSDNHIDAVVSDVLKRGGALLQTQPASRNTPQPGRRRVTPQHNTSVDVETNYSLSEADEQPALCAK